MQLDQLQRVDTSAAHIGNRCKLDEAERMEENTDENHKCVDDNDENENDDQKIIDNDIPETGWAWLIVVGGFIVHLIIGKRI